MGWQDWLRGARRDASTKVLPLRNGSGPYIGVAIEETPRSKVADQMRFTADGNLLLVAPTRSGKARDVLVASLLTNTDSAFIIDIKGELAAITARARREMGHDVYLLNPFAQPQGVGSGWPAHGFNPLVPLDPNSSDFVSDVEGLVTALIVHSEKDSHWTDGARSLVGGALLYDVLTNKAQDKVPTLADMRGLMSMDEVKFKSEIDVMTLHPSIVVRDRLNAFKDAMTNELRSMRSTAKTQTTWLSDPAMAKVTREHDFEFSDLKRKPMTVYVILPSRHVSAGSSYSRYLRLIVQSALDAMMRTPRTNKRPVWFLIDEFFSLGNLPVIERMMSEGAGYGIQLQLVVHNLGQLKELYGQNWETFISGATVKQFFAAQDLTSAKYISDVLGQRTVQTQTVNPEGGVSTGETGQPLMRLEEIMQLDKSLQIVMVRDGGNPLMLGRMPYFDARLELQGKYDANPYFMG